MANIITGRNASIGPGRLTPKRDAMVPCWKTVTKIPKAAPMESRFITAAVSGITRLRKTIASRMNDSKTTRPMNKGSF